ncbi:MAG: hypothetical protein NC489_40500 [Ruminococcus flavefaciens]|nr:hypothetical protein [Ruminococcus flavefaciens]
MNSKKIKLLSSGITLTIVIIVSVFLIAKMQKDNYNKVPKQEDRLVPVNGEEILKKEIDLVYKQFASSGVQYDEILKNSIDEILVIQHADEFGIPEVTESEVQKQLQDYKSQYPDLYNEAVNVYGVDELYRGQKNRMMYDKVKKYVMSNVIQDKFTDQTVNDFIAKYELSEQLEGYSMEQIKKSLKKEIKEYLFDEWVNDIKKNASIVYY